MKAQKANVFCLISLCLVGLTAHAEDLDIGAISEILGYPASEIVVTDYTEKEKYIYSTPSKREVREKLKPPLTPDQIIAAYRITGKTPSTFYPIVICIAKEGAFLSDEFMRDVKLFASAPKDQLAIFPPSLSYGPLDYGDYGSGGFCMIELRELYVAPRTKGLGSVSQSVADISEVRIPQYKIDIRVAILSSLEERDGTPLIEIKGGERYHGYFRTPSGPFEQPWPDAPAFDWTKGIKALNLVAYKAAIANQKVLERVGKKKDSNNPAPKKEAAEK